MPSSYAGFVHEINGLRAGDNSVAHSCETCIMNTSGMRVADRNEWEAMMYKVLDYYYPLAVIAEFETKKAAIAYCNRKGILIHSMRGKWIKVFM